MICTTIQNKNLEQILEVLGQCEMAEIRLDRCPLSMKDIDELFMSDIPLVATCRISEVAANEPSLRELSPQSREIKAMQIAEKRLVRAIESGARYVDVELEAQKQMSKRVRQAAHENGAVFIRSYHDFSGTDSSEALKAIVEKCVYHGADMVKIVTTAGSEADVRRVMSLYEWCRSEKTDGIRVLADGGLITFCMGEAGRQSRLDCLKHGAPFTYAALTADEAAAPGQWSMSEMMQQIYRDFSFIGASDGQEERIKPVGVSMPVSKSFAQRAIIAAALADGTSHLKGYTPCGDNEAAVRVARSIGAEVDIEDDILTVKGISASLDNMINIVDDGRTSEDVDDTVLHVGESGLLARMMLPLVAQLSPVPVTLTGERTLLERNLTGAREIMDAFHVNIVSADARADESVRIPLKITGPLDAGRVEISGRHGSQLISGLLMALPFSEKNTSLIVRDPKSIPYMFITLEVLKKFGIRIGNEMLGGRDFLESDGDWSLCTEMVFKIKGKQKYKAVDMDLEGDWSAAANFLVAGALFGKVEISGLDTTSLQADLSIMDILMDAGASLSQLDGDRGNITVQRAPLKAFRVDASNCPDLFPVISVLATFCQGTSHITGVSRLANKESDRAKAILGMLKQMNVVAEIDGDEMIIEGHSLAQRMLASACPSDDRPGLLKGGDYSSYHDHRMVMALKVAGLGADSPIVIDDEACVAKSFPLFNKLFATLQQ